jgi:hypothetical protein
MLGREIHVESLDEPLVSAANAWAGAVRLRLPPRGRSSKVAVSALALDHRHEGGADRDYGEREIDDRWCMLGELGTSASSAARPAAELGCSSRSSSRGSRPRLTCRWTTSRGTSHWRHYVRP